MEWGVQISHVPGEILLEDLATCQEHVNDCVQSWFGRGCVPPAWTQNDVPVGFNFSNAVAVESDGCVPFGINTHWGVGFWPVAASGDCCLHLLFNFTHGWNSWLPLHYNHGPTPFRETRNKLKQFQKNPAAWRQGKKRTVLETVQKIVHVIQIFLVCPVEPIRGDPLLVSLGRLSDFSFWVTLV